MTEKQTGGPLKWVGSLIVLVLAGLGYINLPGGESQGGTTGTEAQQPANPESSGGSGAATAPAPKETPKKETPAKTSGATEQQKAPKKTETEAPTKQEPKENPRRPKTLIVQGPRGRTDLVPTLLRIERGEKHSHRNDGSVFQNREKRLPRKARGYYREYVHPTRGMRGPGPQRLVIGNGDEVYYTADHYETFRRIPWELQRGQR